MNSKFCIFFFFTVAPMLSIAQCPVADFTAAATGCRNEKFELDNLSTGATSYEWDFCTGDFEQTPQAQYILTSNLLFRTRAIRIINHNNQWFGFTIDQASAPNRLIRFEFGESLMNVPIIFDLGNPGNMLNGAYDFRLYKEGTTWYGLVANSGGNNVLRMTFSLGLQAAPQMENLGGFGVLNVPNGIFFVNEDGVLRAFVSNGGAAEIVRLDFGSSIQNVPMTSTFPVVGGNNLRGIAIVKECDRWFGLVTSYSSGKVFWLDFANGIATAPATGEITFYNNYNFPASVVINQDGGNYYAFIQSAIGPLYKLSFGSSIVDKDGTGEDLGNLGITGDTFALDWVKTGSAWIGFSMDLSNRRLARITLPAPCDASTAVSNSENPSVSFADAGTKKVTLTATSDGKSSYLSRSVVISTSISPDIDFISQNICVDNAIFFTSINSSDDIATYNWGFGDATPPSTDPDPTHVYSSAGDFVITLEVTGQNNCKNSISKPKRVYAKPVSQFVMPSTVLCTNTEITITNSTTDNYDGNLNYAWFIDNVQKATTTDLVTTFTTTGAKVVRLVSSIAGCSDEQESVSTTVHPGPVVDFSVVGNCEESSITFASAVNEPVDSYTWNFDDGGSSDQSAPTHTYSQEGTYAVSLTVLTTNGCNNSKTIPVLIDDRPEPDFMIEGPPSSCTGVLSSFRDLTPNVIGSQLESWNWSFGDEGVSTEQNPIQLFQDAGVHNVELIVTTDAGCSNSVTLPVTILQSPTISFENGPACFAKPTIFNATSNDAVQYYWEIGTAYYEAQNTAHVFNTPGSHTVKLNVLGSNECVSIISRQVNVPIPFDPVFSVTNNCKDFEARFTTSFSSADPVVAHNWNFAGEGSSTEANPSHMFTSTGNKLVTLQVTTASGCIYQRQNTVNVLGAPIASFTFTPDFGVPPQEISFVNSSSNASSFKWDFGDGNSSTANSPKHTFTALGDYDVRLTATNEAACQVTSSQVVPMVAPLPDVDLSLMTITPNADGTSKIIVTIANKGNTFLKNLPISLDVSGNVTLQTTVGETIAPFSMYNLVLDFAIAQTQALEFLCASTTLEGDLNPEGNRICNQLKSETAILSPYPNPAVSLLTVEWVAQEGEEVEVKLVDTDGKSVINFTEISTAGLNQKTLDITNLRSGIYILRIVSPTRGKTHRILVSH